jgi:hypothetical protein
MKNNRSVKEKRKLKLKPDLIKVLTTHDLNQLRGGFEDGTCSGIGNSNPSVPHEQ